MIIEIYLIFFPPLSTRIRYFSMEKTLIGRAWSLWIHNVFWQSAAVPATPITSRGWGRLNRDLPKENISKFVFAWFFLFTYKDRNGYQVGAKSHSSLGNSCLYGLASIHKPTHRDMAARGQQTSESSPKLSGTSSAVLKAMDLLWSTSAEP